MSTAGGLSYSLLDRFPLCTFYYANTFIDFPNIYRWTFLLLIARLLFKYLLEWAILCASLSL